MKKTVALSIILFLAMLLSPLKNSGKTASKTTVKTSVSPTVKDDSTEYGNNSEETDYFIVKRSKTGETEKISEKEYVIGCVSAEIPTSYSKEAIKAQAVASYTFAYRKRENSKSAYDITDDYTIDQSFLSEKELKEKWGDNFSSKYKIISEAVGEVLGERLVYKGKTALAVYHGISPGKTNTSKEVWGSNLPYLCSVDSSDDKLSPDYITTATLKTEEFAEKLSVDKKIKTVKTEKTENGKVKNLICNQEKIEGSEVVKALGLRSGNFDAELKKDEVEIKVYGYGHGVGMSQNGANCMAEKGSDYKEILMHYYKGCEIKSK